MHEEYPPSEYAEKMNTEYEYKLTVRTKANYNGEIEDNIHNKIVEALKELVDSDYIDQYELEWH